MVEIIKQLKKILKGVSTLQNTIFNHHTRHEQGGGDEISVVTKLSELTIDADKNWAGKNITNFGTAGYDVAARLAKQGARDKKNLVIKVNITNPTYQVDVDADVLQVGNYSLTNIDLTLDITTHLDTGSEAPNTWYAIIVAYNPSTEAVIGRFTTSPGSPTLPSGYTEYRRVGWVRNNASSNFLKFYQIGDWWHWDIHHNVLYTSGAATSWTDVGCGSYVPPTSELILVTVRNKDSDSAVAWTQLRRNGSSEDGADKQEFMIGAWGSTAVAMGVLGLTVSCDSSQIIEYRNDGGDELAIINVLGYYDPI